MKKYLILKKQKGSFLIELMVGLLMAALSVLGILTIYAEFEGQKRTTTQMADTLTNASVGLFPLQHETKNAGYGINASAMMGCHIVAYNEDTGDFSFTLAPVAITAGGNNQTSDAISLFYGDSDTYFSPLNITKGMPNSSSALKMNSRFGFQEGNLLITGQAGKDCTLMQVSNLPGAGQSDQIIHNPGTYTDPITGQQMSAKFNKPGGLGINYSAGASVVNLGAVPSNIIYKVVNGNLVRSETFSSTGDVSVANNVMLLKAVYGIDNDQDGVVDEWSNRVLVGPEFNNVRAIRVAIIARSPLREKSKNGACSITTNPTFTWMGGIMDISAAADWQCYRYRKIETTIPVRNLIWRAS